MDLLVVSTAGLKFYVSLKVNKMELWVGKIEVDYRQILRGFHT